MAFQYYSIPVDHYDPKMQFAVKAQQELKSIFDKFQFKTVTTSSLRAFGDALVPTEKKKKEANAVIEEVREVVTKCPGFKINRICVSGSYGKKTCLPSFDLDMIVFINDEAPPFYQTLQSLKSHVQLQLHDLQLDKESNKCITFHYKTFKIDLLPAPNKVDQPSSNLAADQRRGLMQELNGIPSEEMRVKRAQDLSSAFGESVVAAMQKQQQFVKAAIRLVKFWKHSCSTISFSNWATSYLLELVTWSATQRELEQNPSDASLVRFLETTFRQLSQPHTLCVMWPDHYRINDVPPFLAKSRPLVMDPVNPFNNVAKNMDWTTIRILAAETLSSLQKTNTTLSDLFKCRLGDDVDKLYSFLSFQLRFVSDVSWLRHIEIKEIAELRGQMMNPGVTWRAVEKFQRNEDSKLAESHLMQNFDDLVRVTHLALSFHVEKKKSEGVGEVAACCEFIDRMLSRVFDSSSQHTWTPTSRKPEDCDATMLFGQVPISSQRNDLRYLRFQLSFDVDDDAFAFICHNVASAIRKREEDDTDDSDDEDGNVYM